MVSHECSHHYTLGRIFLVSSAAGVVLSFFSLLTLLFLDPSLQTLPLVWNFWCGPQPLLRLLAGCGILLLAATPLIGLSWLGWRALGQGQRARALLVGAIFLLCIAAAVISFSKHV